ncbi:hypothetical protein B7C42_07567 [Nocardia cerradoensis]|uniref:Uncharacterized protein n=1 Tax=Nocardia cerradoensis TaxID=85688 RepID=A0A231GVA0_9NOCA|nr:hypothetical protein B7C42_07567 [Nocardia cerradoensis]
MIGVAPESLCGPALDVVVEGLARRDVGSVGEDALADRGSQIAALIGVARLEDHRMSLR